MEHLGKLPENFDATSSESQNSDKKLRFFKACPGATSQHCIWMVCDTATQAVNSAFAMPCCCHCLPTSLLLTFQLNWLPTVAFCTKHSILISHLIAARCHSRHNFLEDLGSKLPKANFHLKLPRCKSLCAWYRFILKPLPNQSRSDATRRNSSQVTLVAFRCLLVVANFRAELAGNF